MLSCKGSDICFFSAHESWGIGSEHVKNQEFMMHENHWDHFWYNFVPLLYLYIYMYCIYIYVYIYIWNVWECQLFKYYNRCLDLLSRHVLCFLGLPDQQFPSLKIGRFWLGKPMALGCFGVSQSWETTNMTANGHLDQSIDSIDHLQSKQKQKWMGFSLRILW